MTHVLMLNHFPVGTNDKNFSEVGDCKHTSNLEQTYFFDSESYEEPTLHEVIETFVICNNVTAKN